MPAFFIKFKPFVIEECLGKIKKKIPHLREKPSNCIADFTQNMNGMNALGITWPRTRQTAYSVPFMVFIYFW